MANRFFYVMILLSHFLHGEGIESIEFQPPKKSPLIPNKKHRGHAWSVQGPSPPPPPALKPNFNFKPII